MYLSVYDRIVTSKKYEGRRQNSVGRHERMKRGRGMNVRSERPKKIEIALCAEILFPPENFFFFVSSGKLGKQSLRFRVSITVITSFFDITIFLYQNQNPVIHMNHWRPFRASLNIFNYEQQIKGELNGNI